LLSAGVGVTPMLAMLHELLADREGKPPELWWFQGARNGSHHPFAEECRSLLSRNQSVRSYMVYSAPTADDRNRGAYDLEGHIDVPLLSSLEAPSNADFFLCGPASFLQSLQSQLSDWGVEKSRIHFEAFGALQSAPGQASASHQPEGPVGSGPLVTFLDSHLSVPWDDRFSSLLELAEACSVPAQWSCRSGVCHRCETQMVGGAVSYDIEPIDPPPAGSVLICCARPTREIQLSL
jgi:ferredoxin-NADP reductase